MNTLVTIDHFRMDFGNKTVIKDLSFTVKRGEVFGFLGSNGSGKTTTIRALLGIYPPTSGTLHIDGKPFSDRSTAKEQAEAFLRRVKLTDHANTNLDKLSGGQQQKIQLGITIMNDPELLILDEPTKGFDPVNRRLLMDIVEEHRQAGATVIFVTHQMEEVERLCDRIILLKDGRSHAYGTIAEVKKKFDGKSLDDIFLRVYGDENLEEESQDA